MDKQILQHRLADIQGDVTRLQNDLEALKATDIEVYPDNYEKLAISAAIRGECIACRMRHVVYATTSVTKAEYNCKAAVEHGIAIDDLDGIIQVTLPSLLPKRRTVVAEYITEPLYYALEAFSLAHPMRKYRECVVCFTHVYAKSSPKRRIRDYDNIEQKQILDIIAAFIMTDDNGLLCDAYSTTELGETDCTRITVMDKDRFPWWLEEHQNTMKSISDFC